MASTSAETEGIKWGPGPIRLVCIFSKRPSYQRINKNFYSSDHFFSLTNPSTVIARNSVRRDNLRLRRQSKSSHIFKSSKASMKEYASSVKDGLPTTTAKPNHKSRSKTYTTTSSLVLALLSCVAWLYVAGSLWQDAENRIVLADLLMKQSEQLPRVLTVEDKLKMLGCKDLERRIVEAEMDLTLAKSQGFLKDHLLLRNGSSSTKKFLAVIGVYTGFGSHLKRKTFRGSWMPKGDGLKKLEDRGILIRFVIGRSPNRGDSLDRKIDEESSLTKDILILEGHEEAKDELPKKAKLFFSSAVQNWDADFYIKVDDDINLDLEGLIGLLESRRGQDSAYIGCMKSGVVVIDKDKPWYEPEWWKFGDEKSYFRHAAGPVIILSKNLAQYISVNSASLKTYSHDDVSIGSWMMGLKATFIDEDRLCCGRSFIQGKVCRSLTRLKR